jgi:sigma-B regulation protein RsbQ
VFTRRGMRRIGPRTNAGGDALMESNIVRRSKPRLVGSGERVLVLAHGFGSDQSAWRHLIPKLADSRRLLLFDHAGANGTDGSGYEPGRHERCG